MPDDVAVDPTKPYDAFAIATGGRVTSPHAQAAVNDDAPAATAELGAAAGTEAAPAAPTAEAPAPETEALTKPAAAVAAAEADPRIAELTANLAATERELAGYKTAEQAAQINADLLELKAQAEAVNEEYGADSPLGKFAAKMVQATERVIAKADQAQQITVDQQAMQQHQKAWQAAPLMNAIYAADGDAAHALHADAVEALSEAKIISDGLVAQPKYAEMADKDLPKFYQEVAKRLERALPEAKGKFLPGPKAVAPVEAKPSAAAVPPAKINAPATMQDIPHGMSPTPQQPVDVGKMNAFELATFASTASERDMNMVRAQMRKNTR